MSLKISAVIITFNEERNIARCLQSLHGIADEIIVLDSFSTDRTEEICKQYKVKFFKHPFEGHIQQKNKALELSTYNHILSLDADEALSPKLQESIIEIKHNWIADAYYFNRLNNFCGHWIKHSGWYPDKKLRMWDKRKGHWGGYNPHDTVIMQNNATIKQIKGDLLHYTCYTINEYILQMNSFTEIVAKHKYMTGEKASIIKILYKTIWRFICSYFFRLGFLDGYIGYTICKITAFFTFLKYAKLRQLYHEQKK